MRIALICDYSLDYLGGAQSAFLDEARLLRARGHDVLIVAPDRRADAAGPATSAAATTPDWSAEWTARGGRVLPVRALFTLPGVDLPVIRNTARLRALLDAAFVADRIDVVHTHAEFGLSAAAISAARRRGLATVQTVHTFFWTAPVARAVGPIAAAGVRAFGRWLRGFPTSRTPLAPAPLDSALRNLTLSMGRRVDVVVSPSAHQAEKLREAGLTDVRVVPNAVAFDEAPGEPLTTLDGALRLVWVGRLVPEKRLLEWIDAVAQASAALPSGSLDVEIVGEGPLRAEAEALVAATGAPVRFSGRLPRDEVQERMRAAHLTALTSYGFDNQPVTIVEALHARRGVLYVDPALTEGLTQAGIRAPGPDAAAMAETLVRLAGDPGSVLAASARAAEGAADFDADTHVARITAAYEHARAAAARS